MSVNVRDLSPSAQKQVLQKLLASQKEKESKYGNQKVVVGGIEFDSKREARRWFELDAMAKAGVIYDLQRQVGFELIPAQYEYFERFGKKGQRLKAGKRCIERKCSYVADFTYWKDGKRVVEDAKGCKTKEYRLKKKMLLYFHGIKIREV